LAEDAAARRGDAVVAGPRAPTGRRGAPARGGGVRAQRSRRVHTEILATAAVPALIKLSKDAEMVVAGSQGSGRWPGRRLGSVSSELIRHAHCPVAIVHEEDPSTPPAPAEAPVLVGIDGSPASESATAIAFDEASRRQVELMALHAWSDLDVSEWPGIDWSATQSMAEEVLAERLAGWQDQYPDVRVTRTVAQAQPARQLVHGGVATDQGVGHVGQRLPDREQLGIEITARR
jgi:nucleotide-binding universal stress UspA family protein